MKSVRCNPRGEAIIAWTGGNGEVKVTLEDDKFLVQSGLRDLFAEEVFKNVMGGHMFDMG